jgi:hypothetical protein
MGGHIVFMILHILAVLFGCVGLMIKWGSY